MSAARDYLADLARFGAKVVPNGDGLRLVPPPGKPLPPALVARGKALKPELVALLRAEAETDARDAFEERAAIAEYSGGLPREHAELLAVACVVPLATGETAEARQATIAHFAEHLDLLRKFSPAGTMTDGDAA